MRHNWGNFGVIRLVLSVVGVYKLVKVLGVIRWSGVQGVVVAHGGHGFESRWGHKVGLDLFGVIRLL